MTNPHMQAATEESAKILAAIILAKGWDSSNEQTREAFRTDSTTMLTAALPHLRNMIAQEIEAYAAGLTYIPTKGIRQKAHQIGLQQAAQIAEGTQQ